VGLGGELRQASNAPRRLAEAARMGFSTVLVPVNTPAVAGIQLRRADTVVEAMRVLGLLGARAAPPRATSARVDDSQPS
jgi:DNA repair protein RadA/Sms